MTTRLWTDGTPGSLLVLTDEQALARLEAGRHIRPIEGVKRLTEIIRTELTTTR